MHFSPARKCSGGTWPKSRMGGPPREVSPAEGTPGRELGSLGWLSVDL